MVRRCESTEFGWQNNASSEFLARWIIIITIPTGNSNSSCLIFSQQFEVWGFYSNFVISWSFICLKPSRLRLDYLRFINIYSYIWLPVLFSSFSSSKIPKLDLNLIIYIVCVQFAPSRWKQTGNQSEHIPLRGGSTLSTLTSIWSYNYFHLNRIRYNFIHRLI